MIEKINKILREYTGDYSVVVTPETVIKDELGVSSFDLIQIACEIEDEFDIEIPDRVIKDIKTVADVISFIEG